MEEEVAQMPEAARHHPVVWLAALLPYQFSIIFGYFQRLDISSMALPQHWRCLPSPAQANRQRSEHRDANGGLPVSSEDMAAVKLIVSALMEASGTVFCS